MYFHTYRRVGSAELRRTDVRVISATHRNLKAMVADGRFREDLHYRLSTFPIALPALRDRANDIPLLAVALLDRVAPQRRLTLSAGTLDLLKRHPFPRNVRELRNVLERAALLADGNSIDPVHVEWALYCGGTPSSIECTRAEVRREARAPSPDSSLRSVDRAALRTQLKAHRGSRAELAQQLGISGRSFHHKLREIGDDPDAA
ncbi:MAG: sigma 54-interacting transcriptional regulator [Hydrogenophaga sp.]|nr:sigma 54-interacting transcriptional regulator [Burkholderiaceae bacterium]MDZ4125823.1 sigma 54-interacting transcriptional regulator [Hydrogenophaga sp.]